MPPQLSEAPRVASLVEELNHRFRHGRPSRNVGGAGVFVHVFDGQVGWGRFWGGARNGWSTPDFESRISASVINARTPFAFFGYGPTAAPGFVLRPEFVASAMMCSYPGDACTNCHYCPPPGFASPTCSPGCIDGRGTHSSLGTNYTRSGWLYDKDELQKMMSTYEDRILKTIWAKTVLESTSASVLLEAIPEITYGMDWMYNEVVLDATPWRDSIREVGEQVGDNMRASSLPFEAIYVPRPGSFTRKANVEVSQACQLNGNGKRQACPWDVDPEAWARDVRRELLAEYELSPSDLPLLWLDMRQRLRPFMAVKENTSSPRHETGRLEATPGPGSRLTAQYKWTNRTRAPQQEVSLWSRFSSHFG